MSAVARWPGLPCGLLEVALRVPSHLSPSQVCPGQHDAHDHQKDDDVCEHGRHDGPKQTPDTVKGAHRHRPEDCQADRDEVGDSLPLAGAVVAARNLRGEKRPGGFGNRVIRRLISHVSEYGRLPGHPPQIGREVHVAEMAARFLDLTTITYATKAGSPA